jgi:hypothetical protein
MADVSVSKFPEILKSASLYVKDILVSLEIYGYQSIARLTSECSVLASYGWRMCEKSSLTSDLAASKIYITILVAD